MIVSKLPKTKEVAIASGKENTQIQYSQAKIMKNYFYCIF